MDKVITISADELEAIIFAVDHACGASNDQREWCIYDDKVAPCERCPVKCIYDRAQRLLKGNDDANA
jgi:hypothetical protein